jgi:hypothetical protein
VTTYVSRTARIKLVTERTKGKVVRSGCGSIVVNRDWWHIVIVAYPLLGVWGYYDANLKLIVVDGTADDKNFLDTLLHEASHGLDTSRSEKVIKRQGNVLADLLTAFGYKN